MGHPKNRQERRYQNNCIIYARVKLLYYIFGDGYFEPLEGRKVGTFKKHHPLSHHRRPAWKTWKKDKDEKDDYYKRDYPEYF